MAAPPEPLRRGLELTRSGGRFQEGLGIFGVLLGDAVLGRRVNDEPLELMCALILVETLGRAVLVEEPPPG